MEAQDLKQELKEDAKDIIRHAGDYLETFYKLNLVRLTKKVSGIGAGVVNSVLLFFISLCFLLFISLAAAWWISDMLESRPAGFLIVAGFYLLIAVILILMRKKIITPYIENTLIRKMYEQRNKNV